MVYSKGDKMIKQLVKLANHLDAKGLGKEADYLDSIIRNAQEWDDVVPPDELINIARSFSQKYLTGQGALDVDVIKSLCVASKGDSLKGLAKKVKEVHTALEGHDAMKKVLGDLYEDVTTYRALWNSTVGKSKCVTNFSTTRLDAAERNQKYCSDKMRKHMHNAGVSDIIIQLCHRDQVEETAESAEAGSTE